MNQTTAFATHARRRYRGLASMRIDPDDLLPRVESLMMELAGDGNDDPGAQMVREHLLTGGKRMRARLALAACGALGGRPADAVPWAAAVELLHNASLVHDDVQDGDATRRGEPAIWTRYGAAQAINAGDLLLMLPFRALAAYPSELQAALVQILAEYAERTVRGQIREIALVAERESRWDDYFEAVSGKTGTLFALPVRGAAEVAGLKPDQAVELASAFGSIGVLYQLQDDLLDLFDFNGGRPRGSDLLEGRLSAVVLTHLDLRPNDGPTMFEVLRKPRAQTTSDEVSWLIDRFISEGAVAHLIGRIEGFANELLETPALSRAPEIQAVARGLVARVLAPLDAVYGDPHE